MNAPWMRRLSRDELAFRNLLAQRRGSVPFEWLDTAWRCALAPQDASRDELLDVRFDWGGAQGLLRVDAAWVGEVARHAIGAPLDFDATQPLVIAMLEAALGDLAEQVEDATRKRIRIVGTGCGIERDGMHALAWRLECEDRQVQGELWIDTLGLGFLAAAWKAVPASAANDSLPLPDLPVPLRFALGWTDIDMRQLRALRPGDVLLCDECWLRDGTRLVLRVGERAAFDCVLDGTTFEVTEGPRPIMSDSLESQDDDEPDLEPFADLPVRLSFDLGERTVTLAELHAMGAGYSFDLGRELRRAVHVRANGKVVGEGELVEIDGRVGVTIVTLKGVES